MAARIDGQSPSGLRWRSATAPLLALRATSPVSGESVLKGEAFCGADAPGDCRGGIYAARGFTEAITFRFAAR